MQDPRPPAVLSTAELAALVRTVPDFPKSGIVFRDITTLIADRRGLRSAIVHLADRATAGGLPAAVAGIEARGFVFGAALAIELGLGFIPLRKAGKLPVPALFEDYALEYGSARLELDPSIVPQGAEVLLVDDLLATGGTALAGAALLRRAGARVARAAFVVDLPELGGGKALAQGGIATDSLLAFAGH